MPVIPGSMSEVRSGERGLKKGPSVSAGGVSAQVGRGVHIHPSVRIAVPWHLTLGDFAAVGDGANLYSLGHITVGARAGKKIVGVQRGFDNFSAQLMDAQENYHSFLKSDVTSVKREFRSLMPDSYGKMFAKAELEDLVAYLSRLGAK